MLLFPIAIFENARDARCEETKTEKKHAYNQSPIIIFSRCRDWSAWFVSSVPIVLLIGALADWYGRWIVWVGDFCNFFQISIHRDVQMCCVGSAWSISNCIVLFQIFRHWSFIKNSEVIKEEIGSDIPSVLLILKFK